MGGVRAVSCLPSFSLVCYSEGEEGHASNSSGALPRC